ncbi:MAG: dTDP-4-dehydrorhamnose 3,5-epimerase family protein [Deltaproteobacteria bacterium]|nr:dTDP-4-dehydrorhamnose 3,5-epimerase family protein [Deltaproteobacteria bacterium]
MKLLNAETLPLEGALAIHFGRFPDRRGYFAESYRESDFRRILGAAWPGRFFQANVSFSQPGTVRGYHYQSAPAMGKLVRLLTGRMLDLMLDIRLGSPTFGRVIVYELEADQQSGRDAWLWLPPGLAHGTCFTEPSLLEYFCTAEYNPASEGGLSPLAEDLDWSLADPRLRDEYQAILRDRSSLLISDKDLAAPSLSDWQNSPEAAVFCWPGP